MLANIFKKKNTAGIVETEMSFMEHIDSLRKHLFRAALYIIVVMFIAFIQKSYVFDTIILGPTKPDFFTYRFLCSLADFMCFEPAKFEIYTRELGEQLTVHLEVSFYLGLIVAFPLVFREFWLFIKPGLYTKEQMVTKGIVFVCTTLFLSGVLFGYFFIAPFSISFLASYDVSAQVKESVQLSSMVDIMLMFTMLTGLVFELPVVVYFLAKLGIMGPVFMRTYRRHAIVIITIIAAIITPPDVVSMTIVTIPLCLLYELSIYVAARVYPKDEIV